MQLKNGDLIKQAHWSKETPWYKVVGFLPKGRVRVYCPDTNRNLDYPVEMKWVHKPTDPKQQTIWQNHLITNNLSGNEPKVDFKALEKWYEALDRQFILYNSFIPEPELTSHKEWKELQLPTPVPPVVPKTYKHAALPANALARFPTHPSDVLIQLDELKG